MALKLARMIDASALGGWHWLLAPLVVFLSYTLLSSRTQGNRLRIHNIHAVIAVASGGMIWLFLFAILDRKSVV